MAEIKEHKKPLGRGLGSLLGESFAEDFKPAAPILPVVEAPSSNLGNSTQQKIWEVDIEKISPNEFQPRKIFSTEKLSELTESVREKGIIQPIVVRKKSEAQFELIAGERRWRAAQAAGLQRVPVIIKDIDDQESLELALIENLQRHDLNPIEEAEAYQRLGDEFYLNQEEIAKKVGKQRTTVTNMLRLLSLEPSVKQMLVSGELSVGHAKVLLALNDPVKQKELAKKITGEKLTVRAAEKLVNAKMKKKEEASLNMDVAAKLVKGLEEDLTKKLGTKVDIHYNKGQGNISIRFYSDEDLTRIIEKIKN